MGTYKINSKYSLILKSNNKLLCISDNNIYYYIVEENEKEEVMTILKSELFQSQNSKIFCQLLKDKIIIECNYLLSNRNTKSYLEVYTNQNINMEELNKKRVFIIGLGGIGCEIINHLVGVGIKYFTILDFDNVDSTNLNRQYLYNDCDISKSKVDVVEQKIKLKNPSAIVKSYNMFVKNYDEIENIIKKEHIDIVICAADTPFLDIRIFILEACISCKVPCIFGGVSILTGQYGPTFLNSKKMSLYLKKLNKIKKEVKCNNTNKSSFGPTNTIISEIGRAHV